MKFILLIFGIFEVSRDGNVEAGIIQNAVNLGNANANASRDDCVWKIDADKCSESGITYKLYVKDSEEGSVKSWTIDTSSRAWLHSSGWNPSHETVLLINGYGGVADHLPIGILRDAYLQNGYFNVIIADWGALAKIPCYVSAVHNLKYAGKCISSLLSYLRLSGVDMQRTSCIGHSLGAHVCGTIANNLNFRIHRIIGIDPAKPLIPNNARGRLDSGDAEVVQILHTSSKYGDPKKMGHVDFYFNGGRTQPFCSNIKNDDLCSHLRSVCYLAESLFADTVRYGTRCRRRKGILNRIENSDFVPVGQYTPDGVMGSYCVSNIDTPFCKSNELGKGSVYCCARSLEENLGLDLNEKINA